MDDSPPHLDLMEERRSKWLNAFHTLLLVAGSLILLGVSAWIFAGFIGLAYALVFGVVSLLAMRRVSPQMVLRMYKAYPVPSWQFPKGHSIVTELARRAKLDHPPKLYIIPSETVNAFSVGRRDDSAIAVTNQLIRTLTLREFTGVVAHEISHIANEDVRVMALADMVSRFTSLLATVGFLMLAFNLMGVAGHYAMPVPWLAIFILLISPTIGSLLQMALSRTREFEADLDAAMLTGDPDGLSSALVKLERIQGRRWEMMLPGGRIPEPSILRSHPRTEERVARLKALKLEDDDHFSNPPRGARRLERRRSPVPRIPRARHVDHDEPDGITHPEDVQPAKGKPRIHVSRGGVWW